jgi:glutathione peroxidase
MGNAQDKKSKTDFYQLNFTSLDGREIDFSQFKGKKVLIVNTASKCGFTKQYADLQVLSEKYAGKLVVIGFPSDNFGNQELDSNEAIAQFCQSNYGVTFLMMEKSDVKGKNKNTVFQWLTDKEKNGWNTKEPKWNFGKYLIDEQGNLQEFYPSRVNPISKEVVDGIEKQF